MRLEIKKRIANLFKIFLAIITIALFSESGINAGPIKDQGNSVTFTDDTGDRVTIKTPVSTYVYHGHNSYVYETLRAIGVGDRIIGTSDRFVTQGKCRYSEAYYPNLVNFTNVGILKSPDYEVINSLRPAVVISDEERYYDRTKTPRIPVIAIDVKPTTFKENTLKFGRLFKREKEAKAYIDWYSKWEKEIKKRTANIPSNEKPLTYIGFYEPGRKAFQIPARDNYRNVMVRMAGAKGMGDEISGAGMPEVDAEWIITRNPEVMIFSTSTKYVGYDIKDPSGAKALIDNFMSRKEFSNVKAVKNKRVYAISHAYLLCGGASGLIASTYFAAWIYPERFKDVDVTAMHQEFAARFQHLDLDINNTVCVYPVKSLN